MNFFKTFLASCLGSLIALIVLFLLLIGFLVSSFSGDDKLAEVTDNSVLHLKLNLPMSEIEIENPLEGLPIPGAEESPIGLLSLKALLLMPSQTH